MNVFILFLFISTTHCFIYPPKMRCSHTHTHIKLYDTNKNNDELINLLNKNTNLTNIIYKHNFISSINEKVNNCIINLLKRYDTNNDNMINNINSVNVSSINENIKKMTTPLRSWNDFINKKIKDVVKSNNNNNNFIKWHYMLFKNQIFESLTPTSTTKGSGESHCDNCHCYECHIKGCYENDLHTKECEDCHKKGCSGCCNCEECLVETKECHKGSGCCNCDECLVENEEECHKNKKGSGCCNCKECLVEKGHNPNDNNFIDTVGLVPVGILPNFIIRFLLKNLLMPF